MNILSFEVSTKPGQGQIALEYRSIGGDVDEPTGQDEPIGFDLVATSTPIQRPAFELISQPIPQKLK